MGICAYGCRFHHFSFNLDVDTKTGTPWPVPAEKRIVARELYRCIDIPQQTVIIFFF